MEGTDCAVKTEGVYSVSRRCLSCNYFLVKIESINHAIGSEGTFLVETRCPNRKCKKVDKFKLEFIGDKK